MSRERRSKMLQKVRYGMRGVVILLMLAGCTSTGVIEGRLAAPGTPPTPVKFTYKTPPLGNGGTMTVTLPNGETFAGKYVHITSTSTVDAVHPRFWDPAWGYWSPFDTPWLDGADFPAFVRNYSGKVVAVLFGDRGDTMRCRFKLNDPLRGMRSGGVGDCQVSNGAQIAATF